ncbi:TPA: hypothetical protein QB278_001738 [Pasteurella multocida]|nr:hypothetical protein [Pasteurella multocida]
MRNEIHTALIKHLENKGNNLLINQDKEALDKAYDDFSAYAQETLSALDGLADWLFCHGVNEDGEDFNTNTISPSFIISVSTLLKNNLAMLNFSLYSKDVMGDFLYKLAQGGNNEN